MNLFGKKKQAAPRLNEAIQQMQEALTLLDKREKHLEKQAEQADHDARTKAKQKDKRGALFHLKKKKMLMTQVDQIYGKKHNIQTQIFALESAASNKDIINAMRTGKDALKASIKETDVENITEVMDEINEQMALGEEIDQAMAEPLGPVMDDDELNEELAQMESEMLDAELLKTPEVPVVSTPAVATVGMSDAPKVPVRAAPIPAANRKETAEEKEARELKELEAMMNA